MKKQFVYIEAHSGLAVNVPRWIRCVHVLPKVMKGSVLFRNIRENSTLGLELTNKLNIINRDFVFGLNQICRCKSRKIRRQICMKQFYILFIDVSKVDPVDLGTLMLKGLYY